MELWPRRSSRERRGGQPSAASAGCDPVRRILLKSVNALPPSCGNSAGSRAKIYSSSGLVASLAQPGGNVTGYSITGTEMDAKRLAVLHEWLPAVRRVGILENSSNPYFRATREELKQACRPLGLQPIFVEVAAAADLPNAVAEVARRGGQGLLVSLDSLFLDNRGKIMDAVLKHALPTTVPRIYIRETGALVSYDPIESEEGERGAAFIDRILRGAKPADLPVEQPTKFELIINLKTAKVLGISVPPTLLARANDVIE